MVKIIGIFAILYVYYCTIDAEIDRLEFWNPTTEYTHTRRVHVHRKHNSANKSAGLRLRKSKDEKHAKFPMGLQADKTEGIHHPQNGPSSIESGLRIAEDYSIDRDENKNMNNYYHNHDKEKKNNTIQDHYSEMNPSINKIMISKNHDREEKHIKDKHVKHKKRITVESFFTQEKDQNKKRSHNKDTNRNKEKNHSVEKYMDTNEMKDSNHSKDATQERENYNLNEKKQAKVKIRKKNREKIVNHGENIKISPFQIPRLLKESIQGRAVEEENEKKWPVRHHRSKLRKHKIDEDAHIRSTRMIPMSLNQLDDGGGDKESKGSSATYLSPYALTSQLRELMQDFPDANATIESLGRTVEYNDLIVLKISGRKRELGKYFRAEESKYMDEVPEKKIIFIVHGLTVMGMRWLTSLVQVSDLKTLLSFYLKHLDKFDIFIIPMANPDGYSASFQPASHNLWNKNMAPQDTCPGVCLDRNFDVAWNSSREISSCSQLYPGPVAFSEMETKAVRDIFHYFSHKILAYIHVHSGTYDTKVFKGDAILYPRGFTDVQSDDDKYIDMKGEVDEAMKNASFQVMSVAMETLYNWYGKVTGTSVDYASTVYGIPYALEFVMQLYEYDGNQDVQHFALTEIWSRMIDTVFNNMFKSLRNEIWLSVKYCESRFIVEVAQYSDSIVARIDEIMN